MCTFIALNQGTSGRLDVKSDELAFYHIVPRGSLWPGETYVSVSNEGDLAPALNTILVCTYEEEDEPPKPDDKSPVPDSTHDTPLASTVGDEPDQVVFVGPAQFQMANILVPGSPEEQRDTTLDETTPPTTEPPARIFPDMPPQRVIVKTPERVVIKKELHAHVDGATAVRAEGDDGTTILVTSSPKQVLPGTNAEGDLTSDTTLSESIETGARPTTPADHRYTSTGSQALDRDEAEEDEPSWIRKVCNLPLKLIRHSAVLDDAHTQIMSNFFDHIRVTHAEHLCDLNTCKSSFTNALRRWMTAVQERTTALGSNPGAATYNVAVDTVRMHSNELWTSLQAVEMASLVSKGAHDACVQDHEATITAKLTTGIRDAVQAYLDGCVSTLLKYMGCQGNLDPWLAQVSSQAMGFQSRILMQTGEYAGLLMELRSAAVMQQLEMFNVTARMLPLTCPLSYPVPTPRACPTGANAPIRQDQRAKDTGHGVAKDRSSSAAKHSMTTVSCTAASAPKLSTAARPAAQSTAAIGASWLVSLTPARAAPTPSPSQGTAGTSTELPLWDIPGMYSYSSILGMGFIPMPTGRNPPLPQAATQFGVVTSPVPPRVAPVQTVAPSATTTAATKTTLGRGDYSFARAIECKPISTKRRLLPGTRLPTDVIMIDEDPDEVVIDDDEPPESTPDLVPKDTSPEDKSPTMPQKKARVRAGDGDTVNHNFMALGVQVGLDIACKMAGDYIRNTLGATSPDDNDGSVLKKTKSKKEKDPNKPKTEANNPSSSDSDSFDGGLPVASAAVQEICDSIERSATIKKIHSLSQKKDFFFILEIHDQHKLPTDHINQDDMTGFLQEVGERRAVGMSDPGLLTYHIWTIQVAIRALNYQITAARGKGSGVPKEWPDAIAQLKDFHENTPMPVAQECKALLTPVFARYVTRVFVKDDQNPVEPNTKLQGNMHRRVMMWLTKLHKKDAISRHQKCGMDGKSVCPFCPLVLSNHESVNNHVRCHWRMALMCGLCSHVEVDCYAMIRHGHQKHLLEVP